MQSDAFQQLSSRLGRLNDYPQLRFILVFSCFYCLLHSAYYLVPDSFLREQVYYHLIIAVCVEVINFLVPAENVSGQGNILYAPAASLEIVRGCDGAGSLFLLIAGITAFRTALLKKIKGLLLGITVVLMLNLIRVIALYFIVVYQYDWFTPVHAYYAPGLMVLVCVWFFSWWAVHVDR